MISELITKCMGAAQSQDHTRADITAGAGEPRLKLLIWPLADGRLDEFGLANYQRLMAA